MGCLMNVLWLVFGGILTAVEYMIASLLIDDYNRRHSFRYANNEDSGACPVAFRQRGTQRRAFGRLSLHTDECVVDFSGGYGFAFAFGLRRIAVYHCHRYSFRDAAFQTCRFGVGAFRNRYCGIITSYYPV